MPLPVRFTVPLLNRLWSLRRARPPLHRHPCRCPPVRLATSPHPASGTCTEHLWSPETMSRRRRDENDEDEEDASDAGSDSGASSGSGSDSEPEPRGKKRGRPSGGGRSAAPQKKRPGTIFVDDQADVSTDDEGDDSDEGDVGDLIAADDEEAESTSAAAAAARLHARGGGRFRSDLPDESAELQRLVDTRYGHAAQMNFDDDGAMAEGAVGQASLQPTIRDPKLYRVSCLAGREKEGVICLMQKHFSMAAKGTPLAISGAVAPEHLKASIYVEARRADAVRTAVAGLRLLSAYNMAAVPLDEMVAVMALPKRAQKLRPYAWVRITRGMYKDDLAQVFDVREGGGELSVVIRLVPRLDLSVPGEESDEEDGDEEAAERQSRFGKKTSGRRFGLTASGDRPPQRLFDKDELRRTHGSSVDVYTKWDRNSQEEYDWWEKKQFCYGLLYKKVAPKSLLSGDAVHPTVEEVEMFQAAEARMRSTARENDEEEVEQKSLHLDLSSVAAARVTVLLKGDAIRVISGEQKGAVGTVAAVQEKEGVVSVKLKGISDPVPVSRASVVKHFSAGDHVKVAVGRRAGETGVVVDMADEVLTLFSDATKEEFKVLASSVVESSDLAAELVIAGAGGAAAGSDAAPAYELFDLVSLHSDPRARGVVVQVKADGVTILDLHGRVRAVSLRDVKGKVADRHMRALDMRKNPIAANDVIRVADGPLKNRSGIVKHVTGDTVFFQARDEMRNCGMLVVAAARVLAQSVGSAARRAPMGGGLGMNGVPPRPQSSLVRTASPFAGALSALTDGRNSRPDMMAPSARSSIATMSGGMRGGMGGGRGRGRGAGDALDGKHVTIRSGSYKGHKGRVMSANDSRVRVELEAMMKVVTIDRARVVERDGEARVGRGYQSGRLQASIGHGRPPSYDGGSNFGSVPPRGSTPGRPDGGYGGGSGFAPGSRTPAHGGIGMAGGYGGGGSRPFTPSRMATPSRLGDGSRTPGHPGVGGSGFLGSSTPAHPSSYGGIGSATPAHPSFGAESYRPMTPSSRPGGASPYHQPQAAPSSAPYNPYGVASGGASAYPSDVPTPGGMPRTPGTPMVEPRTPGGGGMIAEPRTPAADGGYGTEAGTPYEAVATPGVYNDVPATPGDGFAGEQESGTAEFDALVDVEVTVILNNSPSDTRPARVVSVRPDGAMYTVAWLDGADKGTEVDIGYQELMIVSAQCEPEQDGQAGERVKVIRGDHLGKRAAVVSADDEGEAVLRLEDNQDIIVVPRTNLAKLAAY